MKKTVIHCPTRDLWHSVDTELSRQGKLWSDGSELDDSWGKNGENSCINPNGDDGAVMYNNFERYAERGYYILNAKDWLARQCGEPELSMFHVGTKTYAWDGTIDCSETNWTVPSFAESSQGIAEIFGVGTLEIDDNKSIMKKITARLKRLFNEDQRKLYKAGLMNSRGDYTQKAREELDWLLWDEYNDELVGRAEEILEEEKETK